MNMRNRFLLVIALVAVALLVMSAPTQSNKGATMNQTATKPSDAELKKKLTPLQLSLIHI